jgi:hypothetical protein
MQNISGRYYYGFAFAVRFFEYWFFACEKDNGSIREL